MSWITLTPADVQTCFAGPELTALQSAVLAGGQGDPTQAVLTDVTQEVRGYVAACRRNLLGPDGTIPDELKRAALALVAVRLPSRLPVKIFATDARKKAAEDAITLLRDCAGCRFLIVAPVVGTAAPDQPPAPVPLISPKNHRFRRGRYGGAWEHDC